MLGCHEPEIDQSPSIETQKIADYYNRWFDIVPADTPALREKAYRLRYQVYCCEHEYETPEEHPQQLEMDPFDCRSIHSLIIDRASGAATGTVRLILPDQNAPGESFPVQKMCNHPLLSEVASRAAEVSRFAISKKLRKMVEGCLDVEGNQYASGKYLKISLVLGLMKATLQMSFQYGIADWFAVMEPSLLRLLSRFGICFTPIGPLIEHHGFRQPCHANVSTLLERVRQEHFDLWEFVTESSRSSCCRKLGDTAA